MTNPASWASLPLLSSCTCVLSYPPPGLEFSEAAQTARAPSERLTTLDVQVVVFHTLNELAPEPTTGGN